LFVLREELRSLVLGKKVMRRILGHKKDNNKCKKIKKVKFSLEQAMKAQRGSRGIAILFL
jgi:hypothetical protein